MGDLLIIQGLNFKFENKVVFNNFDLTLKKGMWYTLAGPNGSGKTTLIKIMSGLLTSRGMIKFDSQLLVKSTMKDIRKKIGVVFSNPSNQFIQETVYDEVAFKLRNINDDENAVEKKVLEALRKLKLYKYRESNPQSLNNSKKQLIVIATMLVCNPQLLIIDEALTKLDKSDKELAIEYIKEFKELTVLNVTHNLEDSFLGDEVIIINNGEIVSKGSLEEVFENEIDINKYGIEIPFAYALSQRLKFYELVEKDYREIEEMVDDLWQ